MKTLLTIIILLTFSSSAFAIEYNAIEMCKVSEKSLIKEYKDDHDPSRRIDHEKRDVFRRLTNIEKALKYNLTLSTRHLENSIGLPVNTAQYRIQGILEAMNNENFSVGIDASSLRVSHNRIEFKVLGIMHTEGKGEEAFTQNVVINGSVEGTSAIIQNEIIKYDPRNFQEKAKNYKEILRQLGYQEGYIKSEEGILSIKLPVERLDRGLQSSLEEQLSPACLAYLNGDADVLSQQIVDFNNRGDNDVYGFSTIESNVDILTRDVNSADVH